MTSEDLLANLQLVIWPDERLRRPCINLPHLYFGSVADRFVAALAEKMYELDGVGMAAPQVGLSLNIFVLSKDLFPEEDIPFKEFINPEIISVSEEKHKMTEGCLSFPGVYLDIERPTFVKVRARNLANELFEVESSNLLTNRAILHEKAHLDGKLMVDFVGWLQRDMIKKKLKKLKLKRGLR